MDRFRATTDALSFERYVNYDAQMSGTESTAPDTERKACTLSVVTVRYLEALMKTGTHGTSVSKVMTTLIEQGVRQAIREGFIRQLATGQTSQNDEGSHS